MQSCPWQTTAKRRESVALVQNSLVRFWSFSSFNNFLSLLLSSDAAFTDGKTIHQNPNSFHDRVTNMEALVRRLKAYYEVNFLHNSFICKKQCQNYKIRSNFWFDWFPAQIPNGPISARVFVYVLLLNRELKNENFTHFRDTSLNPLGKHRTIPQINRLSLLWNNSETSNSTILRGGEDNSYSPLPILIAGHESSESPPLPVSCQTSLMQMSTNQYYLVVQINVDEHEKSHSHVYENYPWFKKRNKDF